MTLDIYLAHRNSIKYFEMQTRLIKKYFFYKGPIHIYGYVDGSTEEIKDQIRNTWTSLGVIPIDIPQYIKGYNRNHLPASESFGLAFQYVYETYILKTENISLCMENDIMPFVHLDIEKYVADYEVVGELRFNAKYLPDRVLMFWLGFIIFNNKTMKFRELWNGETGQTGLPVKSMQTGNVYWIDCGGNSYHWIMTNRYIKNIVTVGYEDYDPYTSMICSPHNITDPNLLPPIFRKDYEPRFRVLIYKDLCIHLEQMGKINDPVKDAWWLQCYNHIKE